MASTTQEILDRIRMPLEVLWEIYNEALTWYPRVPIKLVTKTTVPHPTSVPPHPIDVYTVHKPVGPTTNPSILLPSTLPLTLSAPILRINTDNATPVPSLDTLARAYTNMNMCDFSIYAFLGAMREMLTPHGVNATWMLIVPSLQRSTTLASPGPFLLQYYRGAAPWATDPDSAAATDGLRISLHSVFVLEFPDHRTFYAVDFSLEQYGVEHEPNWIMPLDEYTQRYAIRTKMKQPEEAVRPVSLGASSAMALHIDTWRAIADNVAHKWLKAVDAWGVGGGIEEEKWVDAWGRIEEMEEAEWVENIERWRGVMLGLCRMVGLGRYQEELLLRG